MKILKIFPVLLWAVIAAVGPADTAAQAANPGACASTARESILGSLSGGAAARSAIPLRTVLCLQASGALPAAPTPAGGGSFTTFDPPGSTFTVPSGITADGVIVGYYDDQSGVQHGFVRTPSGSFTTLDPPGATFTQPTSVTPTGVIAGAYCDTIAPCGRPHGFVRALDDTFTTFDAPGSSSGIEPGIYNLGGSPPSINPAGVIAGTSNDFADGFTEHGFLRSASGAWTTIDVPGSTFTEVLAINPSGVMVGDSCDLSACFTGFLRTPDGSFTTIDPSGEGCGQSIPLGGINAAGAVVGVGVAPDTGCSVSHLYVRAPSGAITFFDVPGSPPTEPMAINAAGAIAGWFFTDTFHGFVRTPDGAITTVDVPGSFGTAAFEIGPTGAIIGSYLDSNGALHGFLRTP